MFSKKIAITLLVLVSLCLMLTGYKLYDSRQQMHRSAQEQLLKIRNSIVIGDTEEYVNALLVPEEYTLLHIGTHESKKNDQEIREVLCLTPYKLGAGNWVLRIGFHQGKVSYMKIRDMDVGLQDNRPPSRGAPPDVFAE